MGHAYLYLVNWGYAPRPVAFLAGMLGATSPVFLCYSTLTLSEMPFACLMVTALFALERHLVAPLNRRLGLLGLGVALSRPCLPRAIGVGFIPAALAVIFLRRRPVFWVAARIVAASAPWTPWSILAPKSSESIVTGWYTNYLSWRQFSTGLSLQAPGASRKSFERSRRGASR